MTQAQPPYRADLIARNQRVVVVADQRAADALNLLGLCATCPIAGLPPSAVDWQPLAGKHVVLWPNNDRPDNKGNRLGIARMKGASKVIAGVNPAPRMFWVDVDAAGLPFGVNAAEILATDQAEAVEMRYSLALIEDLLEGASPMGMSADMEQLFDDIAAGRLRTLDWPWPCLLHSTKATTPGTVTLICGDPGASKSLWLIELFLHWHEAGRKVALYELEEDRIYHLRRALAMAANDSRLLDNDWIETNADEAKALRKAHAPLLDTFGARITDNADDSIGLSALADWVEKKAIEGCDAIGVDPVTAAATSPRPWEDDREFVCRVKLIARKYGTRVFLVTHPRKAGGAKGKELSGMESLAGGAAYSRFPQTILWLDRPTEAQDLTVMKTPEFSSLPEPARANRIFKVFKARNAPGAGARIAMHFDGGSLRIAERGFIVQGGAA